MSTYQEQSRLNPLSQIPLMKSPFVQFPQAVTLPYNYVQLPSSTSLAQIPDIPSFTPGPSHLTYASRKIAIEEARRKIDAWESQIRDRKIREARRIAPGFLDTGVTMLTPTVSTPRQEVKAEDTAADMPGKTVEKGTDYSDQFASLRF